jgi:hypothetical protein
MDDGWFRIDDPENPPPKDGALVDLWIVRQDGKFKPFREADCSWRRMPDWSGWVDAAEIDVEDGNWAVSHWRKPPPPPVTP